MSPNLDHLSTELLELILEASCSLEDLLNLITASSRCYRIYATNPERFIFNVTKPAVPKLVWCQFCAVNLAMATFQDIFDPSQISLDREEVISFIDKYFRNSSSFESAIGRKDARRLALLHRKITYFIRDFIQKAAREAHHLQQLNATSNTKGTYIIHDFTREARGEVMYLKHAYNPGPATKQSASDQEAYNNSAQLNISDTETVRLYRAFLRFELYCRLFRPPQNFHQFTFYTDQQQFDLLLGRLLPWEVEEITVIHQYLSFLVEGVLESMDKAFEDAVRRAADKEVSLEWRRGDSDEMIKLSPKSKTWSYDPIIFDYNLYKFSSRFRFHAAEAASSIASTGLSYLFKLVQSDKAKQFDMIRRNHPIQSPFLLSALSSTLWYQNRHDHLSAIEGPYTGFADGRPEDAMMPNAGYMQYWSGDPNQFIGLSTKHYPYRALGYVFWDLERINTAPFRPALNEASRITPSFTSTLYGFRKRESSQSLIGHLRVSEEAMDTIVHRFGSRE